MKNGIYEFIEIIVIFILIILVSGLFMFQNDKKADEWMSSYLEKETVLEQERELIRNNM
jgi:uncharacterized protein YpmB